MTQTPSASRRTLVWIDAHEVIVLTWLSDQAHVERLSSDVPDHRKSTGHVRHDASRHGGGGAPQTAGDPRREEHLGRFIEEVTRRLPADDDLLILGPGTVREHLERRVCEHDQHLLHRRMVEVRASGPQTERQLIAELRHVVGAEAPRRPAREHRDQVPDRDAGEDDSWKRELESEA